LVRAAVKTFRFAIANVLGFSVTELVLTVGLLLYYGRLALPHTSFSSPALLGLDVLALATGVSASFFINERITVYTADPSRARARNVLSRYAKFQAVSWVGNAGIIIVQILLLAAIGLSPLVGTFVGAVVTYPLVYLMSIRVVWGTYNVK